MLKLTIALLLSSVVLQTPTPQPEAPAKPSEVQALIARIKQGHDGVTALPEQASLDVRMMLHKDLVTLIDRLLAEYPQTEFRETAQIWLMESLAVLARGDERALDRLLLLTDEIQRSGVKGELGAHASFYGIQAFVLGARRERMPEERRLLGTFERYEAFLKDYPDSELTSVVWASLIRNALVMGNRERAEDELARFAARYPNDPAYKRAEGEVHRSKAVGHPFAFEFTTPQGERLRTAEMKGKVLVVHFWASTSTESLEQLERLRLLQERHGKENLAIVGVSVDTERQAMEQALKSHQADWPQYFDGKGFSNVILVGSGVTTIPTIYVVDRAGILRSTEPGKSLEDLVDSLVAERAQAATEPAGPQPGAP